MMVRARLAVLSALALTACSKEAVESPPSAPVNWTSLDVISKGDGGASGPTQRERAIPMAYIQALISPNPEGLASLLDEWVHCSLWGKEEVRGRAKVLAAHQSVFGAFDDRTITLSRVLRTDKVTTLAWTLSGVQAREWMGVAPTNKRLVLPGATLLWTQDDGTLLDVHVYVDATLGKAQLGVGPKELTKVPQQAMPTEPPDVHEQAKTPEESMNEKSVRAWLDALETGSETAYLAGVTDDVEISTAEKPLPMKGKRDATSYFRSMRRAIGQLDTTAQTVLGIGDFVVIEYTIGGEQLGPVDWLPLGPEHAFRLWVVDLVEMRGDKIAKVTRYFNLASAVETPSSSP